MLLLVSDVDAMVSEVDVGIVLLDIVVLEINVGLAMLDIIMLEEDSEVLKSVLGKAVEVGVTVTVSAGVFVETTFDESLDVCGGVVPAELPLLDVLDIIIVVVIEADVGLAPLDIIVVED